MKDKPNDTPTESESFNVTTKAKSVYITKPTMRQKDVHDELAIAYAKEIVNLNFLPRFVYNACSGCKNGVDKNTNIEQHDVCTFLWKKRIEIFPDMAILMVGSLKVQEKVASKKSKCSIQ